MSLLDAMLLDPHRDPKDTWIARRTDGNKGSGTETDPWNGSDWSEPAVSISSLTPESSGSKVAVAQTAVNHGYADGDIVIVAGVAEPYATYYNGTFVIHSASGSTFKYYMSGPPAGDASGSGITAARLVLEFDKRMREFNQANLENAIIRLGPGEFKTRGTGPLSDLDVGWEVGKGWKIIGSGLGVTTLKVVGGTASNQLLHGIGVKKFESVVNHAEVSDLTVDCNLLGTENRPGMSIAAVRLTGNHVRVRRVRAVRFGTHQGITGLAEAPECFVIGVGGRAANLPEPTDCRIEDCIVEKRASLAQGWNNITCLIVSSGEVALTGIMEHPRGGVIRNCYVDGACEDGQPRLNQQVWGCSAGGRGAVVEGNCFANVRAGGPYHDTWSVRDVTVRDNHYRNVVVGPYENMGGHSDFKLGSALTYQKVGNDYVATFTTQKDHALAVGAWVTIRGAMTRVGSAFTYNNPYNGRFQISARTSRTFSYNVGSQDPGQNAGGSPVCPEAAESSPIFAGSALYRYASDPTIAVLKTIYAHGLASGQNVTIRGAVVNGSYVNPYNGTFPVLASPPPTAHTFAYRMNSNPGANAARSPVFGTDQAALSLTRVGNVATFQAANPLGLFVGQAVRVSGARINGNENNPYNGLFAVTSLSTDNRSFTYAMESDPGADADAGSGSFTVVHAVASLTHNGRVATLTSAQPHRLQVGQTISVYGVTTNNGVVDNPYNGAFKVESVSTNGLSLTYFMDQDPLVDPDAGSAPMFASQNTTPLIRVETAPGSGLYRLDFTTVDPHPFQPLNPPQKPRGDLVSIFGSVIAGSVRNACNGVQEVFAVPTLTSFQINTDPGVNAQGYPAVARAIATPLVNNGNVATFTTEYAHGLTPEQAVVVSTGEPVDPYSGSLGRGTFAVGSVPTLTSFTYAMGSVPSGNAVPSSLFGALWQVGSLVIENNVIELANPTTGQPVGIELLDLTAHDSQFTFRNVIIRGNVVRHFDDLPASSAVGIRLRNCANALVEKNSVDLANPEPLLHYLSRTVRYRNNGTSGGILIQGVNKGTDGELTQKQDELATRINDVLLLAY